MKTCTGNDIRTTAGVYRLRTFTYASQSFIEMRCYLQAFDRNFSAARGLDRKVAAVLVVADARVAALLFGTNEKPPTKWRDRPPQSAQSTKSAKASTARKNRAVLVLHLVFRGGNRRFNLENKA
jgi:hypothetical protein